MAFHPSIWLLFTLAFHCICYCCFGKASPLPSYNVDLNDSSVSGLSSGGYMAVQMHVAYSSIMKGAGIFAGGPYNCARGSINTATTTCMRGSPSASTSISTTESRSSKGSIDSVNHLSKQHVYLFSGTKDTTVVPSVMNALNQYYKHFIDETNGGSLEYVNTLDAAHTQPTDDPINKNACTLSASPYISYCGYDGAGQALETIYGPLNPPANGDSTTGDILSFDQTEFISSGKGMDSTGYVYVPKGCADNQGCKLHVAFHGCLQSYSAVGDAFVKHAGYNKWADANNLIILYPQTISSYFNPSNPNGCWDWWGYDSTNYDVKSGPQMVAIKRMMDRISSGFSRLPSPTDLTFVGATDSSIELKWEAVPDAAGYRLLRDGSKVNNNDITDAFYNDTNGLQSGTAYEYAILAVSSTGAESEPSSSITASTTGSPPPIQAPTDLTVVGTTASSISIRWKSVSGAADYAVYRNDVVKDPVGRTSEASFTDTKLAAETQYSYQVSAFGMEGDESAKSASISANTTSSWVCQQYTASNYDQVAANRAYNKGGYCYAIGSEDYMGLYNTFDKTTLAETKKGYYIVGSCSGV